MDKASKARDKQFNNFATISISTIGFPSVLTTTSKDSDDSRKRDKNNRQPENMATGVNYEMTPYATPLRPGDEDAMSQSSGMSMASTIFDGANDVRADTLRDAQDIVSGSCRKFIKKYDEAIANDDDVGATSHADGYRLECVNNAWRFVEEVRRGFCGYGAQDVQARENVAAFIKRWGVRIEKRPLLQEELRSVPGYDRDFPKEEDVHSSKTAPAPKSTPRHKRRGIWKNCHFNRRRMENVSARHHEKTTNLQSLTSLTSKRSRRRPEVAYHKAP